MTSLEQIQQDIQTLPQDALNLVAQYIQLLKKSYPDNPKAFTETVSTPASDSGDWSSLIGYMNKPTDNDISLTSLIGSAPGSFATPAEADQFIRKERDEWDY